MRLEGIIRAAKLAAPERCGVRLPASFLQAVYTLPGSFFSFLMGGGIESNYKRNWPCKLHVKNGKMKWMGHKE